MSDAAHAPGGDAALGPLLAERRILVCVGTGGVGKTTVAAALALAAARRGQRALVVTIDPAKRLADALGLASLDNEPRPIASERLAALGAPEGARLEAMMLDMKRTFDQLVERFAPDAASVERILENPIYQHVSDALAGSAEYSAMEKVYELSERDDLDLIVLDTPPSQHALDFLEAPERLIGFLESRVVQVLIHPAFAGARIGFRLFQRGVQQALRLIERVSGIGFLEDISEFLLAIEGMSEGFRQRALDVRGLLFGPASGFVLAAGPASESVAMADGFLDRLEASGADVRALVLNRVRVWPDGECTPDPEQPEAVEALARALAAPAAREPAPADAPVEPPTAPADAPVDPLTGPADAPAGPLPALADEAAPDAARAALRAARSYVELVEHDERATRALRERARRSGCSVRIVPEFSRDVHDLDSLSLVASHLTGDGGG